MITTLLAAACIAETAKEALEAAMKHYQSLSSFSATIESHDASGLFPGNFTQTLKWKKGNRFELVTVKKSDFVPAAGQSGLIVPDFLSNGKQVLVKQIDGMTEVREPDAGPNVLPGWEVAGSPVLGWLLKSRSSRMMFDPPSGTKFDFSFGDKKQWEGMAVREIVMIISQGDMKFRASMFLDSFGMHFVGHEYEESGKRRWQKQTEILENPNLPSTLGDFPK
jgi:hypothetical protein